MSDTIKPRPPAARLESLRATLADYDKDRARGGATPGDERDKEALLARGVGDLFAEIDHLRAVEAAAFELVSMGCSDAAFAALKRALGGNEAVARFEEARGGWGR